MTRPVRVALAAVAAHLLAHLAHGIVHELVPVRIAAWQTGYVAVVIFGLPLLGAGLLVRGRPRRGAWFLVLGGLASLAFEVASHFVVDNPDNVGSVEAGMDATTFGVTAMLSAGAALVLVAAGVWLLRTHRQGGSRRSTIESST